jgi:hypothetical protein
MGLVFSCHDFGYVAYYLIQDHEYDNKLYYFHGVIGSWG